MKTAIKQIGALGDCSCPNRTEMGWPQSVFHGHNHSHSKELFFTLKTSGLQPPGLTWERGVEAGTQPHGDGGDDAEAAAGMCLVQSWWAMPGWEATLSNPNVMLQ